MTQFSLLLALIMLMNPIIDAFVTPSPPCPALHSHSSASRIQSQWRTRNAQAITPSSMKMSPITNAVSDTIMSNMVSSSSMWISTIDADIANLSDNEFAPIFAGGILVMFGGLLSAIIVGTIVDQKNLYATIVAESYAQGDEDDQEFWKGLSEEEKRKTQELLKKIKENDNRGASNGSAPATAASSVPSSSTAASSETVTASSKAAARPAAATTAKTPEKTEQSEEIDIFSDY
ncbi:hypothetical protein MPSEU_001094000 [Mayamaea pseudoterrestris]|nr:hypothetical protein MPSEU_001094000 [Mayamaea pseudoterrestris]